MTQADRVLSTPPTNTPAVSSRRGFLAKAAVVAAGGAALGVALPLPAMAVTEPATLPDTSKAGPALKAAVTALDDASCILEAARTEYEAAEAKVAQWDAENPVPTSKRGKRRHFRKWNAARDQTITQKWYALLEAEKNFKKTQGAVATIQAADRNELTLMAAAAAIYDKTRLTYGQQAIISYQVALSYFRLHGMA